MVVSRPAVKLDSNRILSGSNLCARVGDVKAYNAYYDALIGFTSCLTHLYGTSTSLTECKSCFGRNRWKYCSHMGRVSIFSTSVENLMP